MHVNMVGVNSLYNVVCTRVQKCMYVKMCVYIYEYMYEV